MRRTYLTAAAAAAVLTTSAVAVAHPSEGGGSYASVAPQNQQTSVCTGTIVDDDGEPLIGATVRAEGTQLATSTNMEGKFSLNGVKKAPNSL